MKFMILSTFIIKPHTFHKQYNESMLLAIYQERNEIDLGMIPANHGI